MLKMPIRFFSFPDKVSDHKGEYLKTMSVEDKIGLVQQWSLEMLLLVDTWSHSLHEGPFKTRGECVVKADKNPDWSSLLNNRRI